MKQNWLYRCLERAFRPGRWRWGAVVWAFGLVVIAGCGDDEALKKLGTQLRDVEAKVDDLRSKVDAQPNAGGAAVPKGPVAEVGTPPVGGAGGAGANGADAAAFDRAGLPGLLTAANPRVRRGAALLISQFADPALRPAVVAVAQGPLAPEMAATTVLALSAYLDDADTLAALKSLLAEKDYKLLRERVEMLSEVREPKLAPVLLEREQQLELANIKQVDWDLVVLQRSLVTVMGAQGNAVVVPRMLELIRQQSLAAQQAQAVLITFHDDAGIPAGLAAIMKEARENPPAKIQIEFSNVYNCLMVARKLAGPEALTRELVDQIYNADNNYRSAAYYALRDWTYEKRAEYLLAEVLKPENEVDVPNMKGTKRWELALRCLNEAQSPDTDAGLAGALQCANPEVIDKTLGYLRNRPGTGTAAAAGAWLKKACADAAFLARDEAGPAIENATGAIYNTRQRGGFTQSAAVYSLIASPDFEKASADDKKQAKLKNLEQALRFAGACFDENGSLSDCTALQAVYNKLPDGDLKKGLYNSCQQVRWPISFSEDLKTMSIDQAKLDEMLKNQKLVPKLKPENDQF